MGGAIGDAAPVSRSGNSFSILLFNHLLGYSLHAWSKWSHDASGCQIMRRANRADRRYTHRSRAMARKSQSQLLFILDFT